MASAHRHEYPPKRANVLQDPCSSNSTTGLGLSLKRQHSGHPLLNVGENGHRHGRFGSSRDRDREEYSSQEEGDEDVWGMDDVNTRQRRIARQWRNLAKDGSTYEHSGAERTSTLSSLVRRVTGRRPSRPKQHSRSDSKDEEFDDDDRIELTARTQQANAAQGFQHENWSAIRTAGGHSHTRSQPAFNTHQGSPYSAPRRGHKSSLSTGMINLGTSLGRSRTMRRAGDVVRSMSKRVVNVGRPRAPYTQSPSDSELPYGGAEQSRDDLHSTTPRRDKSLGLFGPTHPLRMALRSLLDKPYTEPIILLLIIAQVVIRTIEAARSVFVSGREPYYLGQWEDYALLVIFSIFALEICARIIVSGLIINSRGSTSSDEIESMPSQYSPPQYNEQDASKQNRTRFRQSSVAPNGPSSLDSMNGIPTIKILNVDGSADIGTSESSKPSVLADDCSQPSHPLSTAYGKRARPRPFETLIDRQKNFASKDAYLRHTWNRMDCIAVISFWISVILAFTGVQNRLHLYLFQALSVIRSFRLLCITRGTSTILQSLKKAGPLLLNVAVFILFAVVLFSVIGVQSFKGSFQRHCVWQAEGYILQEQMCGGYIDPTTNQPTGYLSTWANGTTRTVGEGKGYICAKGQVCQETGNPHNGTVGWDNIFSAAELVVVISSVNTWTDLMYDAMDSDLFWSFIYFVVAVIILNFWLVNLFVAVVINMFSQIRSEGRRSAFTDEIIEPLPENKERHRLARIPSFLHTFNEKTKFVWVALVLINIIFQSLSTATDSDARARLISQAETICTILFAVEIILRFMGNLPDWRIFFRSGRNCTDLVLAVVTVIIQIPPIPSSDLYGWLTAFQVARFYRVILAIPRMKHHARRVVGTFSGLANMTLFLFMLNYIATLMAVQLFRGGVPLVDSNGNNINVAFYQFWNGFIGMYQILSSENWSDILYNVSSYELTVHQQVIGIIFLLAWFCASYFLVLQMFVAVINENFVIEEEKRRKSSEGKIVDQLAHPSESEYRGMRKYWLKFRNILSYPIWTRVVDPSALDRSTVDRNEFKARRKGTEYIVEENEEEQTAVDRVRDLLGLNQLAMEPASVRSLLYRGPLGTSDDSEKHRKRRIGENFKDFERRQRRIAFVSTHPSYDRALFCLSNDNIFRKFCQRLVLPARGERMFGQPPHRIASLTFRGMVFAAVVGSVIISGIANPVYRKLHHDEIFTFWSWYNIAETVFGVVYLCEFIIKVVADGFIYAPNAYLLDIGNDIDFVVLVTLLINLLWTIFDYGYTPRIVRALTAFRALRLINLSKRMRDTFYLVWVAGMSNILDAMFLAVLLIIPFAVWGQNLFSGLLYFCTDETVTGLAQCFDDFTTWSPYLWNIRAPRAWINPYVWKFDNFWSSFLILFEILSMEGWIDVMFSAVAITGADQNPQAQSSQANAVYFIIWNIFGAVLILTVFVSIVIENFERESGTLMLTNEQRTWQDLKKLLSQQRPSKRPRVKPEGRILGWMYQYATRKAGIWSHVESVALIFHIILLMGEWYGSPSWVDPTRDWLFLCLTGYFAINVAVKFFGLRWDAFRRNGWNIYDLIAVGGAVSTLIPLMADSGNPAVVQLNKLFLVAIALKVLQKHDGLDQLMKTAAGSLPAILSIFSLWLILFLVFTIALMECFGLTKFGTQANNNMNFRSFGNTFVVLARMSTGEGWNTIMHDYAIEAPTCVDSNRYLDSDCGSRVWAYGLFIAWNVLSSYIFLNMFTGVVVQNFSFVFQIAGHASVISRKEMRRLKKAWAVYDPQGTQYIQRSDILPFLARLEGAFDTKIYPSNFSVPNLLGRLLRTSGAPPSPVPEKGSAIQSPSSPLFVNGLDVGSLRSSLRWLPILEVQRKREILDSIYQEAILSLVPEKGLHFRAMLLILALNVLVDDEKSLQAKDLEKRLEMKERIDEQRSLERVRGLLKMMFWRRAFLAQRRTDYEPTSYPESKLQSSLAPPLTLPVPIIAISDQAGSELPAGSNNDRRPQLHLEISSSPFPAHTRSPSSDYPLMRNASRHRNASGGRPSPSPASADRRMSTWEELALRQEDRDQAISRSPTGSRDPSPRPNALSP